MLLKDTLNEIKKYDNWTYTIGLNNGIYFSLQIGDVICHEDHISFDRIKSKIELEQFGSNTGGKGRTIYIPYTSIAFISEEGS